LRVLIAGHACTAQEWNNKVKSRHTQVLTR
jgi:hypothetical protein